MTLKMLDIKLEQPYVKPEPHVAGTCRVCKDLLTEANTYVNRVKNTLQSTCKACGKEVAKQWRIKNKSK
jgi:RNase P subunit RPR2